jgi:two-component system response regulator HydG
MPNILIVDDDHYTTHLLSKLLEATHAGVAVAHDGTEARQLFANDDFNLILMDQRLPGENGLDLLQEMRLERPQQMAILMSGYADVRDALRAVRDGLFDYVTKPFPDLEQLEAIINRALELDRAYREITALRHSLDDVKTKSRLIGRSTAMERLNQQVAQVAPLDTTVLVEGESGTGKTLLARAIHALSPRAEGPFLEINCGAVPEPLLESTLFGFERGAFTGAARTSAGYFEMADGGTLFLDDITDMSPKLQSSLLHVLQEQAFSRIGSTKRQHSDFRLICATNKPLLDCVRTGEFREDLYYRINVVALSVPPLRSREDDIVLLAVHFLQHFNAKFGKSVGPFTPNALERLVGCPFPGNIRQLEHAIERIVALRQSGPIVPADLDDMAPTPAEITSTASSAVGSYNDERQDFERQYLARLMMSAGGNVTEASRLSGIPRQSLYVRMKRWGYVMDS